MTDLRDPGFRYRFKLRDGTLLHVERRDATRVVDKRTPQSPPETLWEIKVNGVVRRVWPEEIAEWELEDRSGGAARV